MAVFPKYWRGFVEANQIARKSFHFTESDDVSGIGADLTIQTAEDSLDEVFLSKTGGIRACAGTNMTIVNWYRPWVTNPTAGPCALRGASPCPPAWVCALSSRRVVQAAVAR